MSRVAFYGLCFLGFGSSMLAAKESHAQELKITDVYITVDWQEVHVSGAFSEIEKQTDFFFAYEDKLIRKKAEIRIIPGRQSVADVLNQISQQTQLQFQQKDQYILVGLQKNPPAAPFKRVKDTPTPSLRPESSQYRSPLRVQVLRPAPVSGTVRDEAGNALAGATVRAKDTNQGVLTDSEGRFQLNVPEGVSVLVISYIGYTTQEVEIGGRSVINIVLAESVAELEQVVVTAFGIKKLLRETTYATQKVNGDDIARVGNPNILNGLQGKVAGVTVRLNSGMPGKSPGIVIRGSRSLTGNNAPLYVVDGLPISGGERVVDLNPSDIESVNVLKGPAASALYGLRAYNGVVVITTKNGADSRGKPSISFDSYYGLDYVGMLPDLQMEYAQGENGVFNPNSIWTWGPRISDMTTYTNQLGEQEEPGVYDNDKAFFQTGHTINNNQSFANSGNYGNYIIGIGRNDQTGIVPNTSMARTNFKFGGDFNLLKNLTATISFNYSDLKVSDLPEETGNTNLFRGLTETPPSYNLAGTRYADPGDPYRQVFYRVSQNNPYWVINNAFRAENTRRTLGNILLRYQLSPALAVNYRVGVDHFTTNLTTYRELGYAPTGRTNPPSGGSISLNNQFSNQINSNLYLTYNQRIKDTWSLDVIVGNEAFETNYSGISTTGSNLVVGNWPSLGNATLINGNDNYRRQRIVGFYSNVNAGWKDRLYLNASGRNDIVSNMPAGKRSFFYPSVGLSAIVTELLPGSKAVFSYAKLRATFAEVGQAGPLYVNGRGFNTNNPGRFIFPYQGLASWSQSSTRINPDLRPENTRTIEVGGDLRFLNDRIGIDYTYFDSKSDGQIFNVPVAITTGASTEVRNGGKLRNTGHEIVLYLVPIQSKNFRWEFNTNFTTYSSEVLELYGNTQRATISSSDVITLVAEVGSVYPAFIGSSYMRDPQSNQIVYQGDPTKPDFGLPLINTTPTVLGTPTPDFEMNFNNSFTFKGLTLTAQVDWRSGGLVYSQSYIESLRRGLAGETRNRDIEFVPEGKKGTIANGQLIIEGDNNTPIKNDRPYYDKLWQINEVGLNDASFIRLREVALAYRLPATWLTRLKMADASIYFTGRNLFLITDSFYDPEVNITEGPFSGANSQGIEISQIPQTRSYGAGIRLKF